MRGTLFFQLLLNTLFATFFCIAGIGFLIISLFDEASLVEEVFEITPYAPVAGAIFLFIGGLTLIWTLPLFRRNRFETVSGTMKSWIEEGVIDQSLTAFLKEKFASEELQAKETRATAAISKNKLHIVLYMPRSLKEKKQKEPVDALAQELKEHLRKTFGYIGDFSLAISCR